MMLLFLTWHVVAYFRPVRRCYLRRCTSPVRRTHKDADPSRSIQVRGVTQRRLDWVAVDAGVCEEALVRYERSQRVVRHVGEPHEERCFDLAHLRIRK